jgi:hypothetical protein
MVSSNEFKRGWRDAMAIIADEAGDDVAKYVTEAAESFRVDPPDTDFQIGCSPPRRRLDVTWTTILFPCRA